MLYLSKKFLLKAVFYCLKRKNICREVELKKEICYEYRRNG